eukprot:CAMPEP_0117659092 /NCGR_PEP_ID=MMETSP0804-20121206/6241_1 /TAXON_ID=1074897 /ORGANISM="Tetraselmis astigmatica, Strain CCMP880" /LENGTH=212 /DNA_ID=CAMNT_0005465713 /DNA_START=551 /DNA_END=1191 /DNA_ORIENTATION=-
MGAVGAAPSTCTATRLTALPHIQELLAEVAHFIAVLGVEAQQQLASPMPRLANLQLWDLVFEDHEARPPLAPPLKLSGDVPVGGCVDNHYIVKDLRDSLLSHPVVHSGLTAGAATARILISPLGTSFTSSSISPSMTPVVSYVGVTMKVLCTTSPVHSTVSSAGSTLQPDSLGTIFTTVAAAKSRGPGLGKSVEDWLSLLKSLISRASSAAV